MAGYTDLIFRQLFDKESSTYTYLLADPVSKEALLIDPVLEQVERDLMVIDDLGLKLTQAANTHAHADHITGTGKIKHLRPDVKSAIGIGATAKADIQLSAGDDISVGPLQLKVLPTPGHTQGCSSYYLPPGANRVGMVFTGDALLIRSCGRTDFQGGSASQLYDSVHGQLFTLPGDTLVYPAHDYKGQTVSTIDEEKALNPRLANSKEKFVDIMANLDLPKPKKIDVAVPANLKCGVDFPYEDCPCMNKDGTVPDDCQSCL